VHNYVNRTLTAGRRRALHHGAGCHRLVVDYKVELRWRRVRGLIPLLLATQSAAGHSPAWGESGPVSLDRRRILTGA
jgi:hypothetical protein